MKKATRAKLVDDQQKWIDKCGGGLAGYVAKYGDDRGPAIYQADVDALHNLQNPPRRRSIGRAAAAALMILAFAALSAPAIAEPVCVWGKQADLIARMESGRPGFDALMVEFEAGKPIFVLLRRGETLPASCN